MWHGVVDPESLNEAHLEDQRSLSPIKEAEILEVVKLLHTGLFVCGKALLCTVHGGDLGHLKDRTIERKSCENLRQTEVEGVTLRTRNICNGWVLEDVRTNSKPNLGGSPEVLPGPLAVL